MNWITNKNEFFLLIVGELKKDKSTYFYDSYLQKGIREKMEPLEWWKQATTSAIPAKFVELMETLFLLPASTGGVERSFSTMGNIHTNLRNRLSVEKITKLCCINNYFKIQNEEENRKNNIQRESRKRKFSDI